ncbi:hypothetical protein TNIN_63281 [Trichonephila inaurata madagascariensis]|uniref:Uncharacterized protein n=1 Tax=Trichonephila inaurata madagascariensis TaxID=2747483 RepID=A0A8X7BY78_9ARAC|nr:hypothetical protein TNIN_63281 [Trichonephila inaurata madagascariensis]
MSGAVCQRNGGESDRVLASNCAVIAKQTIIVLAGLSMAGQHAKNSARFTVKLGTPSDMFVLGLYLKSPGLSFMGIWIVSVKS